jgi:hypothetical protein
VRPSAPINFAGKMRNSLDVAINRYILCLIRGACQNDA